MNKIYVLFTVFFCILAHSAKNSEPFEIEIRNEKKFTLRTSSDSKTFRIAHSIDGYSVNCKKDRLLLWGIPNNLSVDAPQMGAITLVNIKNKNNQSNKYWTRHHECELFKGIK